MIAKQDDLAGVEGPGVSIPKDKKLDKLADEFTDLRDSKAKMAEEMTAIETKIVERMVELEISLYRYADREVRVKQGKVHVKVKTVRVGDEK
jgi:hypothetical protein